MNVPTAPVNTEVYVCLKDMEFNAIAQLVSRAEDVKSTLMSALVNLVTTEAPVPIYLKAIDAHVRQDMVALIVKKKGLTVKTILVLREPCAKMNQGSTTTRAYADLDTLALIVI